jgi:small subunit ribosomal protein S20
LPAKARPKKNLSAMKRTRQSVKLTLRNRSILSSVKTVIKKVEESVESGNRDDAGKALLQALKTLNSAASKGVIHRNTVSRQISRLTRKVNAIPAAGAA